MANDTQSSQPPQVPTILYEADASSKKIRNQRVAVVGYGSQGHAHALNLKESGVDVCVGLREGSSSWDKARDAGLVVKTIAEAASWATLVMLLAPDTDQKHIYENEIEAWLAPGDTIAFAHGFNIHFERIIPRDDLDVIMIAPKGPGHLVRRTYTEGGGVPMLIAVAQDATGKARKMALSYADAIGGTRAGVIETTFKEETETDLFGEQAVLCGGLGELIKAGYDTLTEAGYAPEMAYFECLHEVKLIVDLIYENGLAGMNHSISTTAEFGGMTRGPRIVTERTRATMRAILGDIQSGKFAAEWIEEYESGGHNFQALRDEGAAHPVEIIGVTLRDMMPFIKQGRQDMAEVAGG